MFRALLLCAAVLACGSPQTQPAPTPAPEPEPEPVSVPESAPATAKTCTSSADCAQGELCQGPAGCDAPWTCGPAKPCTRDLVTYCGCDGQVFQGSGSCPQKPYKARGPCAATQ